MPRHSPPRRNIDEHIRTAKRCLTIMGLPWRDDVTSRAHVRKLIENGFLTLSADARAIAGRGTAQRMPPRSYHAFLRILRWKLLGVVNWDQHRIGLWLLGYDFPIEDVKRSFDNVMYKLQNIINADIMPPPGRWAPSETFHKKYERYKARLKKIRERQILPEFNGLLELIAPSMTYPDKANQVDVDVGFVVDELQLRTMPAHEKDAFKKAFSTLQRHIKAGSDVPISEQRELMHLMVSALSRVFGPYVSEALVDSIIYDAAGRPPEELLPSPRTVAAAIQTATPTDLLAARSGTRHILREPSASSIDLFGGSNLASLWATTGHTLRSAARQSPMLAAYIFGNILMGENAS